MEISQASLGLLFSLSVGTGAGMGVLWSLLRFLRSLCGETDAAQPAAWRTGWHILRLLRCILFTLADILFGLLCGVLLILLLYYANDGQPRLLALLGCGCGFFAWYHTLGRLVGRLTDRLSRALRSALRWLLSPLRRLSGRVAGAAQARYRAAQEKRNRQKAEKARQKAEDSQAELPADTGFTD